MNKISVIIFTYKRAILLQNCLETLLKNFKNLNFPIHVIYHYDKGHEKSYLKLQEHFKHKDIKFYKREKVFFFRWISKLLRPLNLLWILRWPVLLKEMNNFKEILENILEKVDSKFVTLCPDDMIYFDETLVDNSALKFLNDNGDNYQYRYFTSDKFNIPHNINKNLKKKYFEVNNKQHYFSWSLKDKYASGVWKYRFTVEGTVYNKKSLLKFLKPMIYHNPITLEAIGLWESRIRNFFDNGLSSVNRTAATYQVNNVQNLVNTATAKFDSSLMMQAYNLGYKFLYEKNDFYENYSDTIPKELFFYKNDINSKIKYEDLKLLLSKNMNK